MPLFAVIGFDKPNSMELREKHREEHRGIARANENITRLAGAMYDSDGKQCGTIKIFEAENAEQIWRIYRNEPFFKSGVYADFHIVEWKLAFNVFEPTGWVKNYPTGARNDAPGPSRK